MNPLSNPMAFDLGDLFIASFVFSAGVSAFIVVLTLVVAILGALWHLLFR